MQRSKIKDDVLSGPAASDDDVEDISSEYERLDMSTIVKPDAEVQRVEKSPKPVPKPGSPPKPARRTTINKYSTGEDAKQEHEAPIHKEEPSNAAKDISKEGADDVLYDGITEDDRNNNEDESCYLALSQTTRIKPPDNNQQPISDDPTCHSISESEKEVKTVTETGNPYEEGNLTRMHKNSVYNKDVVIPDVGATKEENKESGAESGSGKGKVMAVTGSSSTSSKTISSGSEDSSSYERVETMFSNSVMIYDDVMGNSREEKPDAQKTSPRQSEWTKTVQDMDGMLEMYDSVDVEAQKKAKQPGKPYEGKHMYHEVNEAEMIAHSGDYSEIPTNLIRRSIGSKKLPPMQALIDEMVTTETDYVAKLHMLDKVFFVRLMEENKKKHILPESDVTTMLSTLPVMHVLHETSILPNLQEQQQKCDGNGGLKPAMAAALEPLVSDLEIYMSYASTLDRAVYLITFWKQRNANIAKIVNGIEKLPACGIVPLHLHLFEPLHRLTAYQGFLKRYLHFVRNSSSEEELKERKTVQDVLEKIAEVSEDANNAVKQAEERVRREELERRLGAGIVQGTSGELVKEGPIRALHPKTANINSYYLFMFSDVLLVTQPYKGPSGDDYKVLAKMPVSEIKIIERIYGSDEKSIAMTSNEKFFELLPSENGKPNDPLDAWLNVLLTAIENLPRDDNTQIEVIMGKRVPMLERFQDHIVCMQCGEPFKRSRKRHHCKTCGRVICPPCSSHTLRMRYRKNTSRRICDECYVLTCKRRTSSVDIPIFLNNSPTSPRQPTQPKVVPIEQYPKPDLLSTHSVSSDMEVYVDPSTMDTPPKMGSSPSISHSKSSSIDSQISSDSGGHVAQNKTKEADNVFDECSEFNPKFPTYSIVSKHGLSPQITFAKEIADKKSESKDDQKQVSPETSPTEKPVPMRRSISRKNTKSFDSPLDEVAEGNAKPKPAPKPKLGGWMKLLRKMSSSDTPDNVLQVAPTELSADKTEVTSPTSKQVAAVRLPSAMPGEAWMGVVAEFKGQGRSMDNESEDDLESTTF